MNQLQSPYKNLLFPNKITDLRSNIINLISQIRQTGNINK